MVTWQGPLLPNEGRVREEDIRIPWREWTFDHSYDLVRGSKQKFISKCMFFLLFCHVCLIYLALSSNLKYFDRLLLLLLLLSLDIHLSSILISPSLEVRVSLLNFLEMLAVFDVRPFASTASSTIFHGWTRALESTSFVKHLWFSRCRGLRKLIDEFAVLFHLLLHQEVTSSKKVNVTSIQFWLHLSLFLTCVQGLIILNWIQTISIVFLFGGAIGAWPQIISWPASEIRRLAIFIFIFIVQILVFAFNYKDVILLFFAFFPIGVVYLIFFFLRLISKIVCELQPRR